MLTNDPWVALGIAATPAVATAIVASPRSVLSGENRRRKKVLTNLDFISRLRDYEAKDHVTLSPHVFDRAHADLARSTRLYVDRNSWQWIGAFFLMYGALMNVAGNTTVVLIKTLGLGGFISLSQADLPAVRAGINVLSAAVIVGSVAMGFAFLISATWSDSVGAFTDRDNHLVPRPGPALLRPPSKPHVLLTEKEKKRMEQRLKQLGRRRSRRTRRRRVWRLWLRLPRRRILRLRRSWRRRGQRPEGTD